MKRTLLLIILFLALTDVTFAQLEKINKDSINQKLVTDVYFFAFNTFNGCESWNFPKLNSANSSRAFENAYSPRKLVPFCEANNKTFGKLIKINLYEIVKDSSKLAFRYKAKYEKIDRLAEIRIIIDEENKFNAIYLKPYWFDQYYERNTNAPFKIIELDSIDEIYIKRASDFVNSTYNNCNGLNFSKLTRDIATRRLIESATDKQLKTYCNERTISLGEFIDFQLIEILSDNVARILYRYKAKFTESSEPIEIIITTNIQNELAGFNWRIWNDKFYDINQEPKEENK